MVFSVETIKESRNLSIPMINDDTDESYGIFENTMDMLMHESINFEATINEYLGEAINITLGKGGIKASAGINPVEILTNILESFLKFIENLSGNFKAFLTALLSKHARLQIYKSKLANFRGPIHYNRYYYEYSNLTMDTGYSSYGTLLEHEYNDLLDGLERCRSCNSSTELASVINDIYIDSHYNEEDFNIIRGRVLGLNKPVTNEDFKDEIFKFFRGGDDTPIDPNAKHSELNIDGRRVHEAYEEYYNNDKHIRIIERDKTKLKNSANEQKRKIKSTDLRDFNDRITPTKEVMTKYHSIISNKCRKVKTICDIYTMLFDGKIDAYKEYNVTNKNILIEAIKEIVRQDG